MAFRRRGGSSNPLPSHLCLANHLNHRRRQNDDDDEEDVGGGPASARCRWERKRWRRRCPRTLRSHLTLERGPRQTQFCLFSLIGQTPPEKLFGRDDDDDDDDEDDDEGNDVVAVVGEKADVEDEDLRFAAQLAAESTQRRRRR